MSTFAMLLTYLSKLSSLRIRSRAFRPNRIRPTGFKHRTWGVSKLGSCQAATVICTSPDDCYDHHRWFAFIGWCPFYDTELPDYWWALCRGVLGFSAIRKSNQWKEEPELRSADISELSAGKADLEHWKLCTKVLIGGSNRRQEKQAIAILSKLDWIRFIKPGNYD